MPAMRQTGSLAAPSTVLLGWLSAAVAVPSALLAAAVGQGLGAVAGGCQWIGISLPMGRPVWALVNQPALDFASRPTALGYWLGSLLLPLVGALGVLAAVARPRSVAGALIAVELAWGATLGMAWRAFLDPVDGHLVHWLALHDLPRPLVWTAPALAALVAVPTTLRLLSTARAGRAHLGRRQRLGVVVIHLIPPALLWLGLGYAAAGRPSLAAAVAMAPPVAAALAIAFLFYPPSPARTLGNRHRVAVAWMLAAAIPLGGLLWLGGRPLGGGRWTAVLWARPDARNNIRAWIEPRPLPWVKGAPAVTPSGIGTPPSEISFFSGRVSVRRATPRGGGPPLVTCSRRDQEG